MEPVDIRAYANRDWIAVEASKVAYWRDRKRSMTPAEILAVGDQLREHARSLQKDWPSPRERSEDLATHERVSEALRRVSRITHP